MMSVIRLILVDDQPVYRHGLSVLLKEKATDIIVVGESSNIEKTVVMADRLFPDLIIMDLGIQNGNGLEFIHQLRDQFPQVKLLVLSSEEGKDNILGIIKSGVSALLLKTCDIQELIEAIRSVINGRFVLSPHYINLLMVEIKNSENERSKQLSVLSKREKEVLWCASQGHTNQEIANSCEISLATVKSHIGNIMRKLEAKNRMGAVAIANACRLFEEHHGLNE